MKHTATGSLRAPLTGCGVRVALPLRLAGFATLVLLSGCTAVTPQAPLSVPAAFGPSERIPISIDRPAGTGPFPAVVIMHDCSGLGPKSSGAPARWSRELVARGFVVARPDSFSTRGFPAGVCSDASPARSRVSPIQRARDAYAALAHLRALPEVDGRRVGLMGGSHGGSATLSAISAAPRNKTMLRAAGGAFAAAVALYPGCTPQRSSAYQPLAPLLILAGELDDWTPARACEQLAGASREAGYPVSIKVYPGAHHAFDSANPVRFVAGRVNGNAPGGRGATTGGNVQAWDDSIRTVSAFFARHLRAR
jgi:dienelactone hydrolase